MKGDLKDKVLAHAAWVELTDVFFRVHKTGVHRIREKGVRGVVAWAEGELVHTEIKRYRYHDHGHEVPTSTSESIIDTKGWKAIRFDAFKGVYLFTKALTSEPVTYADRVILNSRGECMPLNPR